MKLSVLNESRRPCYGIYYWIPVGNSWDLYPYMREALTFGDGEYGGGRLLLHRYFWEDAVAKELGLTGNAAYAYFGLPRGRVSATGRIFSISYAETPFGERGLAMVRSRFYLPRDRTEYKYDEHMRMDKHDRRLIEDEIEVSFKDVA